MKKTKFMSFVVSMVVAVSSSSLASFTTNAESNNMRDISTMDLVRDMGIGINLGNTLESSGDWIAQWSEPVVASYETAWGSPIITKEIIDGYANEGFGVLRIPVAWSNMMEDNYTINSQYMKRVQEIVDWTIDADMYAIINIHWDNGWVNKFPENPIESMERYTKMWEQICEGFKDYNDYLMFESQNEELGWESLWNPWGGLDGKEESYTLTNEINQKFVDIVRSSGGNNGERHLLISGYNTSIDRTCDPLFKMPIDPMNRCAISVHYYTPASFAILEEDAEWAKMRSTWGTPSDFDELYQQMDLMETTFIDKGIPVIIGEYGCPTKNKELDSVRLFLKSVCKEAYDRQLCPVLWDTTDVQYSRDTYELKDKELKELLMAIPEKTEPIPEPTTEPTEPTPTATLWGDANCDGTVTIADVVAAAAVASDPTTFTLTAQGTINADVHNNGDGVSALDASMIQEIALGKIL